MTTSNDVRPDPSQNAATASQARPVAGAATAVRPAPLPGFLSGAIGGLVGVAGASLLLVPVVVLGIMHSIASSAPADAASDAGGPGAPVAAVALAAPAAPGPSASELGALRMLPPGDVELGEEHYAAYCSACHGADGKGKPSLGKDLIHSAFVKDQSDAQLIAFIKRGRDVNDPLNTTKIPMPPKAGNPAFTDSELNDVVAYMRLLQKKG